MQPDLILEHGERAHLAAITSMPGWAIVHRILRAEADKFIVALLNANAADDGEVLAKHKLAKSAAMYYEMVTNRVNEEVTAYTAAPKASDKPRDVTEGIIDLGEMSKNLPFFGGEEF